MRILLYEWVTGGGLVEEPGAISPSLFREGNAMLSAVAADFLAIGGTRVSVLKDLRLDELVLPGCEITEVHSASDRDEELLRLASDADHVLVIAPEFDQILLRVNGLVRTVQPRLLASPDEFVLLTSDKQRTADVLEQAGVPVPEAIVLDADAEHLPSDFTYPAVLKPIDGAGSQHTYLVGGPLDEPPSHSWPRRLERYCPGTPASVAFLCGPSHRVALPPCRQHLSRDDRLGYLGGSRILEPALAERAVALADRALEALPPALGYVGVDLVLGKSGDGSEDVVIEINPRLTTSYVGLRAISQHNLAAAMLENAAGTLSRPEFHDSPLEFLADGTICHPQEA